jgi:predicted RNase H-like HicB family nuclease
MCIKIEIDREEDGRWIAEAIELPGVMVYGVSRQDALERVQALALHVIAERIEHHQARPMSEYRFECLDAA